MKKIIPYLLTIVFLIISGHKSYAASDRFITKDKFIKSPKKSFKSKALRPLSIKIPNIDNIVVDKVKIKSSASKKKASSNDMEMVFFDYSKKKKAKTKKKAQSIEDILKTFKMPKKPKYRKQKEAPGVIDYHSLIQQTYASANDEKSFKINVTRLGIDDNTKVTDFDLIPFYDLNEVMSDHGTGNISIFTTSKNHDFSTFRGTIVSRGLVRTNFELSIQQETTVMVPAFSEARLEQLLDIYKIREKYGSYLLIDLGDDLDSTSIEGKYAKKIFLNERFKAVEPGSRYRYEMYLDVKPGNHLVEYMDDKGKVAQKILHIVPEEITYDEPLLEKSEYEFVELFEENIVSKKLGPLNVENQKIYFFNTEIKAKKEGLNRYKVRVPLRDLSFRKYLEIGDESIIYVGYDQNKKIVIPSRDYVSYMKKSFDLYEDSKSCIIQFNLNDHPKEFKAYVNSDKQSGNFNIYYMDRDGTLSEELTGLTERVFVVSHDYGVVNAKYTYKKEVKYIQSFCSESLYLIEQL